MPGHGSAVVLSFSRIARDRRVQRQCAALAARGELQSVIGYADAGDEINYPFESLRTPQATLEHRLSTLCRQMPAWLGASAAEAGFWRASRHRWALDCLNRAKPRRIVANDWPALVVAAAYKRSNPGIRIHYDTHEFATAEFDESLWWRIVYKPFVRHLEKAHIGAADAISTVGAGLAEALQQYHRLPQRPVVIRNFPDLYTLDERPTAWPLRLLYHGLILPSRGLEALINSMPLWRSPHHLTIRGDGDPDYIKKLQALAANSADGARLIFEPAVAPDQVIPLAARSADLGVFVTPLHTPQQYFSMPNKLFEYIGAGLAVIVSPGADLRAVVEQYGVGLVCADAGYEAVAAAINDLDPAKVNRFRAAARMAAQTLCWKNERAVFDALQDQLVRLP